MVTVVELERSLVSLGIDLDDVLPYHALLSILQAPGPHAFTRDEAERTAALLAAELGAHDAASFPVAAFLAWWREQLGGACYVGSHAARGAPSHMEDRSLACALPGGGRGALAAVLDGHGGHACAQFGAARLLAAVLATPAYGGRRYEEALSQAILHLNDSFLAEHADDLSGSTLCAVLRMDEYLYIANVGDSRAVLRTSSAECIQLTVDHSPDDAAELARIWEAGGDTFDAEDGQGSRVVAPDNVSMVACSRSIGDRAFKAMSPPYVPATPDVSSRLISETDHFIVIASDGVWDVCPNKRACDVVAECLGQGGTPMAAAEALCNEASKRRSEDNISVVVMLLNECH
ncbi:hypothetical protein AB1Y20_007077 [Prymnesium parvum]|uniref:PPM-type phosphatase domain-containing protein n=1 Tax=Prymnesium parvum TaxID=97485 RepID=A0AB34J1J3_PRYPA